jgi:hypothetical protein
MSEPSGKNNDIDGIKRDWLTVLETLLALKNIVRETSINFKEIPGCLILAQKLNNQFDYFEKIHKVPNLVVSKEEFRAKKTERDKIYQALYKIFDEVTLPEITSYIRNELNDNFIKYKMYVTNLKNSDRNDVIEMMQVRDNIKYLYDELEIWSGRWKGEEAAESCNIKEKLCQEILDYDNALTESIKKEDKKKFKYLADEAKSRLILKPEASRRFNFWWWYAAE